jgi:hypothetical protein
MPDRWIARKLINDYEGEWYIWKQSNLLNVMDL